MKEALSETKNFAEQYRSFKWNCVLWADESKTILLVRHIIVIFGKNETAYKEQGDGGTLVL